MAIATDLAQGTVTLTADLHGSTDPYSPELTATGVVPGEYITPSVVVDQKGRILYIQNNAIELPCADVDVCGGVKIPTSGHINIASGQISLPYATVSDYGVVKPGSGFAVTGGVLSVDYPEATNTTPGLIYVPTSNGLSVNGTTGQLSLSYASLDGLTAGAIKIGSGLDIDANGVVTVDYTEVPDFVYATESDYGIMRAGVGLDDDGFGVISVDLSEVQYADATEITKGIMQVGNGLDVTNGVVSVDLTELTIPDATESTKGIMQVGNGLDVTNGVVSVDLTEAQYTSASTGSKGVVQIGSNINVSSGIISVPEASAGSKGILMGDESTIFVDGSAIVSCTNIATGATLGLIRAGNNLTVDGSGVISRVSGDATAVSKGIVQIGSNLDVTSGVISVPDATAVSKGAVQIGSTLSVTSGVVEYNLPNADNLERGGVQIGSNIDVASGVISVPPATNTTLGVVKSADTNNITIDGSGGINVGTGIMETSVQNTFTGAQIGAIQIVPYSSSITLDFAQSNIFMVTLTGDTTFNVPSNFSGGGRYIIIVKQDEIGGHNAVWNNIFNFLTDRITSQAPNAVDMTTIVTITGGFTYSQHLKNFS